VVLSDVLVSGFTTGAALHVLTSQLKGIFGMSVPRQTQFPKLIRVSNNKKVEPVQAKPLYLITLEQYPNFGPRRRGFSFGLKLALQASVLIYSPHTLYISFTSP
jgi:hypothetical protein